MKYHLLLFAIFFIINVKSNAQCNPTIQFNNLILCPNSVDTLKIQGTYSSIQWWKDNAVIPGATNNQLVIDHFNYSGSYVKAQVSLFTGSTACTGFSDSVLVDGWVFMPPFLSSQGNFQTDPNTGETIVCEGDTFIVELSNTFTQNIQWFNNGVLIPGATTNQFFVQQSGSYTASGSPSICPSYVGNASIPVDVNVVQTGIPQISASNLVVCQGSPVTLTAIPSTNLQWNTGSTLGTFSVTQPGTYWARGIGNYSCLSDTSNQIIITSGQAPAAPQISALSQTTFCEGDSVILSASTASNTYIWNTSATGSLITAKHSGIYFVKSIGVNGCTSLASDTIQVTVNQKPNAPVIQVNGLPEFCEGDSVILTSNYSFGNEWNNGAVTQQLAVNQSGIFKVKHTDINGCQSDWSNEISTFSIMLPVQAQISQTADTLFSNVSGNYFYQWYFNNNPIPGATSSFLKITQNGNYQVKITQMAQGCSSFSDVFNVTGLKIFDYAIEKGASIYPNPAQDYIIVQSTEKIKNISILNVSGQQIYNEKVEAYSAIIRLNSYDIPAGLYLIMLEFDSGKRVSQRLVTRS